MQPPSRPPNRSDGSGAAAGRGESGGGPPPAPAAAAAGAQNQQTSRADGGGQRSSGRPASTGGGGVPDSPPRCRARAAPPLDSLGVFQKRSIFSFPRRSSSGYFSWDGDSLPSSPLSPRPSTADRATQTPSPSSQAVTHTQHCLAEAHGGGPGTHGSPPGPTSARRRNAAGDMPTEAVGQELRRIGDDFNRFLLSRRLAGRRRHLVIHPDQHLRIHQEPTLLLCVGLLLLVIGRIIYLQGSTESQDHSQV